MNIRFPLAKIRRARSTLSGAGPQQQARRSHAFRLPWLAVGLVLTAQVGTAQTSLVTPPSKITRGSQLIPGHVPAIVKQLQPVGSLPASTNLTLAIGLPLRNKESLTNLMEKLYDPSSPLYRHYLGAQDFAQAFGPSEKDYEALKAFAVTNGLNITGYSSQPGAARCERAGCCYRKGFSHSHARVPPPERAA